MSPLIGDATLFLSTRLTVDFTADYGGTYSIGGPMNTTVVGFLAMHGAGARFLPRPRHNVHGTGSLEADVHAESHIV